MANNNLEQAFLDDARERYYDRTTTPAENMWWSMQDYVEQDRRDAAAECFSRILAEIPEAYRNPFVTNALKDGIEITLGLRPLPQAEQGEQQ